MRGKPRSFDRIRPNMTAYPFLRDRTDLAQHTGMNPRDDRVAVQHPVCRGLQAHGVPGALEPGAAAGKRDEAKLATPRAERAVEVGRGDVLVRAPFLHRRWLLGDVEGEAPPRLSRGDRLEERT